MKFNYPMLSGPMHGKTESRNEPIREGEIVCIYEYDSLNRIREGWHRYQLCAGLLLYVEFQKVNMKA